MYKLNWSKLLDIFHMFVYNHEIHKYETRQSYHFHIPTCRTNLSKMSIKYQGPVIWNELSANIDIDCSIGTFKKRAKRYISGDHVSIWYEEYCLDFTLASLILSIIMGYVDHYCCNDMLHCPSNRLYHIVVFHCIVWFCCVVLFVLFLLTPPASGVLIYLVTDMGAYNLISFLLHYVYVFVFSLRLWNKTFVILSKKKQQGSM